MQDPTRSDDRRSQASPCCVCSGVKATLTFAWIARERAYLRDLGRAFGGALLFMLPLLMTTLMSSRRDRGTAVVGEERVVNRERDVY